jgi:hypothetical protein
MKYNTSVFTIFLYIYLYNVFSQHVSVVYDHHQAVFTCILTPVFYYSSAHWPIFTFGGKMLLPFMIKLIGILNTYKLKRQKLFNLLQIIIKV